MANADPETIVKEAKTIAVVGASNNPEKTSRADGRGAASLPGELDSTTGP